MTEKKTTELIIFPDDPAAAEYWTNISGWVSREGKFYGDGPDAERLARWAGSTHQKCDKGHTYPTRSFCRTCGEVKTRERYNSLEFEEYNDGIIFEYRNDMAWSDMDGFLCYCEDNDIDPDDVMLMKAQPNNLKPISTEYWEDELPDNIEDPYPAGFIEKLDEFNAYIKALPVVSYSPGSSRTKVPAEYADEVKEIQKQIND